MLSKEFAKKLGIVKGDFTKVVKPTKEQLRRYWQRSLTVAMVKCDEFLHKKLEVDYENWDFYDGAANETNTCCGVAELTNINEKNAEEAVAVALQNGFEGAIYYSIDKKTTAKLKELGFDEVAKIKNHRYGHKSTISVLILSVN